MCTKPVDNLLIMWKTSAKAEKIRDKLWITLWIFLRQPPGTVHFFLQARMQAVSFPKKRGL